MSTQAQGNDERHAVDVLRELIQLEYDAMAAYRSAAECVDDVDAKSELAMFFADHEGCAQTLSTCIERYGGESHVVGDLQTAWSHGRVALANAQSPEAVMSALEHLEASVHEAYEKARDELRSMGDAPLAAALDAALVEEDEHREWLSHAGEQPSKPA